MRLVHDAGAERTIEPIAPDGERHTLSLPAPRSLSTTGDEFQ
jgi:hypothetical protein